MKLKNFNKISFSLILMLVITSIMAQNSAKLRTRPFDLGWSFKIDNITSGPEKSGFDVSSWRKVDLPHDWGTEDVPNQIPDSIVGPFIKSSPGAQFGGYISCGKAWYRNTFRTQNGDQGKTIYLQFDGVYMNSDVWVNGHHLGSHPYGYTPFYYDLTPFLLPLGQDNVIAVQVKNDGKNSRWYSGSGIYRHVWLTVVNPVHVDVWGMHVTTPKVGKSSADAQIAVTIKNVGKSNENLTLLTQLVDKKGKVFGLAKSNIVVKAASNAEAIQIISINKPKLWSSENPNLYTARVVVLAGNKETDISSTTFGFRDIKIDTNQGLVVNGVSTKLRGGCIHHDYGPLGAAAIDRAEERKIELLKANGFNAIRCSHNPPSQGFLDICDRVGMFVIDEAFDVWEKGKVSDDYSNYFKDNWNQDLTAMILRDRNHPSIVLWSIGNEIPGRADSLRLETRKILKQRVRELDPTRMVTEAVCDFWDVRRTYNWDEHTPAIFKTLDVGGYNYEHSRYESDHEKYPERIIVGTESYPSKALEIWNLVEKNPYVIGDFVWTAMDYRGEAGCGYSAMVAKIPKKAFVSWPWFNANCGDFDFVGDKKPQSYYRDVVRGSSKIEMFTHIPIPEGKVEYVNEWGWPDVRKSWTWPGEEGKKMQVVVYTRCQTIKLELNGKVIAEKKVPENSITVPFEVPYQAGTLIARGYDDGREIASFLLKTVGAPVGIRLKADRDKIKADRNDLSYVAVEIIDANGNFVPNAEDIEVSYTISGNGELAGVGNGNPIDVSSFQQPKKKVFQGKGQVVIRPTGVSGKIILKAKVKGLKDGLIEVSAQ
jgi:beta-galactosidase